MALDIPALARGGVDLAFAQAASVMTDAEIRLNPSTVYDSGTDTSTVTWGAVIPELKGFFWADKNLKAPDNTGRELEGLTKMCLLRAADIGNVEVDTSAEVEEGGLVTWFVSRVDTPPGGAIVLLYLYR